MLARALEYLLADRDWPPPLRAGATVLLGVGFVVFVLRQPGPPSPAEQRAAARATHFRGVLWQKLRGPRGDYQLFLGRKFYWTELPDLAQYFPPDTSALAGPLPADGYRPGEKFALPTYMQPGDSLRKSPGTLTILVKRGTVRRLFEYRIP